MRLAFYAPLKSPEHAVPSGDREIARNLLKALRSIGATVTLASELRSRDGQGDAGKQAQIRADAFGAIPNLVARGRAEAWQAWVTYHNYYKAPDLLGPTVSNALGIPYIQIESTRARKRLSGPWAGFAKTAEQAADAADMIFFVTHRDAEALERDAPKGQKLRHLPPFLPWEALPPQSTCIGPMLAVGMMRPGDKLASYSLIAQTLAHLPDSERHINLVGDGSARSDIAKLLQPFGTAARFCGQKSPEEMTAAYLDASLLLWPGVNEAFGLVYLEAQAHGLPVVAQDRPGVRDVLAPGPYPAPEQGPAALAQVLRSYLDTADKRRQQGAAARAHVSAHHLLPAAAERLKSGLAELGVTA